MAGLIIDSLTKRFDTGATALDRLTLHVRDGEYLAVLGPSGCGKTTLLRLIAGFETVTGGSVMIGDQRVSAPDVHVPPEQRRVGIVFQSYALWPHMSVAENVGYALKIAGLGRADRDGRVAAALATVDLTAYADRPPALLSGGQKQRVALARCLAMSPSVVLLDEPLANLDVHLRGAMEDEFADFHRRTRTTMIHITHDQAEAMALADRIAVLDGGRLLQVAPPSELYREPANETVAGFVGRGAVVDAAIVSGEDDGHCRARLFGAEILLRCAPGQGAVPQARVCLRSDDLVIGPAGEGFSATVRRVTYQGGHFRVEAVPYEAPAAVGLQLRAGEPISFGVGDRIRLSVRDGWVIPGA